MLGTVTCPVPDEYRRLAQGKVTVADAEGLLFHLEQCPNCSRLVSTLPEPDALVEILRKSGTIEEGVASTTVVHLIEEMSRLRPVESVSNGKGSEVQRTQSIAVGTHPLVDEQPFAWLAPPEQEGELGRLGSYRLLRVLGEGGGGIVFHACDMQLNREVALKVMRPVSANRPQSRQRFLREAQAAAALKHDHIVSIYQVGEDRGIPFLAMELLEGESLDTCLQRQHKLPFEDIRRIGREIALGLQVAHQAGLIHRDIKPSNIWLDGRTGRVKLLDFGLARATWENGQITEQGAIVGTPEYMSPEQAQGRTLDQRSDLFSLGSVLYRLATGTRPFHGTDLISTLLAVSTQTPTPPASQNPELPRALSDLILQLLAKEPKDRPASAHEVIATLDAIPLEPLSAFPKPAPRRRWLTLAVVSASLLIGLVLLWGTGVLRVKTKEGTIVLTHLPADAEVTVDGASAKITYGADGKTIEVQTAPGDHQLLIKAAGFVAKTEEIFVETGERKPLQIRLEAEPKPKNPEGNFVSLFNGRDLTGLQFENALAKWTVEKGVLVGRWPGKAEGGSRVFTPRSDYRNFRFRIETTLSENWPASIIFGWKTGVFPRSWYRVGIGTTSGQDELVTGVLRLGNNILAQPTTPLRFRPGQWITQEVVVEGKKIRIYVNGVLQGSYEASEPPMPGHVGLTLPANASIRIRKMEIMELPD